MNSSVVPLTFTYRSGVCFELNTGFDTLANLTGTTVGTASCYNDPTTLILSTGKTYRLNVIAFELYSLVDGEEMVDFNVDATTVTIFDLATSPDYQSFPYSANMVLLPGRMVPEPQGLLYNITPGNPFVFPPFDFPFQVTVERDGPDGPASASNVWYIPVTGTVGKEVPNVYPVASDPTLIYTVIRDPPGGGSFATLHSGTTIDFALSIDTLHTVSENDAAAVKNEFGLHFRLDDVVGLGYAVSQPLAELVAGIDFNNQYSRSVSFSRASNHHYDVSLSFSFDISTSTDPNIAGHASDVIVGGGVVLIVSEATIGEYCTLQFLFYVL